MWAIDDSYVHKFVHKFFVGKNIFYVACTNKTKKCPIRSRVGASKFIFFIQDTINIIFSRKLVCEHRMSRYTCKNLLPNFLTLQNVFSHNEFICTHEPFWISLDLVLNHRHILWIGGSSNFLTFIACHNVGHAQW
jgi:hypothetical protein